MSSDYERQTIQSPQELAARIVMKEIVAIFNATPRHDAYLTISFIAGSWLLARAAMEGCLCNMGSTSSYQRIFGYLLKSKAGFANTPDNDIY